MKEFRIQSLFFSLFILFTLSAFASVLTVIYENESFGYSLLLIKLPINYQKEIGINTRVFSTDLCQVDEKNCSVYFYLLQICYSVIFTVFYTTLLIFKSYAIYSGAFYVLFGLFFITYVLVTSQEFKFGIILCLFNLVLAAVLVFLTYRKARIEKNILKYDVVQQNSSDIIRMGNESARSYDRQINESQLDLNDMQIKLEMWMKKYKAMKQKCAENQKIIENLESNLKDKERIIKQIKNEKKVDTISNPDLELVKQNLGA